jgi:hypothetical protein
MRLKKARQGNQSLVAISCTSCAASIVGVGPQASVKGRARGIAQRILVVVTSENRDEKNIGLFLPGGGRLRGSLEVLNQRPRGRPMPVAPAILRKSRRRRRFMANTGAELFDPSKRIKLAFGNFAFGLLIQLSFLRLQGCGHRP